MYFGMVELEFALPWFHLRVEIKAEDGIYYKQVLPSGIEGRLQELSATRLLN